MKAKQITMWVGAVGTLVALASAPTFAADGKAVFDGTCKMCHGTGMMGAPKVGDKAAWKDRIAQGEATLDEHAINGFKAMKPKGGNAKLSDDDVKAAVHYMVEQSK